MNQKTIDKNIFTIVCILIIFSIFVFGFIYKGVQIIKSKQLWEQKSVNQSYLEPEHYLIANIDTDISIHNDYSAYYGYIHQDDYNAYQNGTLKGTITIKHPYIENQDITISVNSIKRIQVGIYYNEIPNT